MICAIRANNAINSSHVTMLHHLPRVSSEKVLSKSIRNMLLRGKTVSEEASRHRCPTRERNRQPLRVSDRLYYAIFRRICQGISAKKYRSGIRKEHTMKKLHIIPAILLLLPLFVFTACNETDPSVESTASAEITEAPTNSETEPVSPFGYSVEESGEITVTSYVGNEADVVIPQTIDGKNVTKIGMLAFSANQTLRSVTLPDSVTEIEGGAFFQCTELEMVVLSSNLVKIGNGAFEATAISRITFPQSLRSIGMRAFADCTSLKNVTITPHFTVSDEAFCGSGLETVVIEDGVEVLGTSMFASTKLREVILPQSLKTIGMNAFGSCSELGSITLNDGLVTIDTYAFANTNITEIVIPQSVTELTDAAFQGCDSLQKVKFEGNAPTVDYVTGVQDMPSSTIYYHANAIGFTSPEWNGYQTDMYE